MGWNILRLGRILFHLHLMYLVSSRTMINGEKIISVKSEKSLIKNTPISYKGIIELSPFNFNLNVIAKDLDLNQLFKDQILFNEIINSGIFSNKNLNGIVNSWDASLIGRFMNDPNFNMNDSNIRWKFESNMDSTTNIAVDWLENIMIYGIKLGDTNGSWD